VSTSQDFQSQSFATASESPPTFGAQPAAPGVFAEIAVWLVIGLTALNVVSTLLECGLSACADNPLVYEWLKRGG
jgi:hypothetical protein